MATHDTSDAARASLYAPRPGATPPTLTHEWGSRPVRQPPVTPRTSGLAVASMIFGFFMPVLAVGFGYSARRKIRRSRGALGGAGFAKAGIILGWLWIVGAVVLVGVLFGVAKWDASNQPSKSEFVDQMTTALEVEHMQAQPASAAPEVQPQLHSAYRVFSSCAYDILNEESQLLRTVYDDPTAGAFSKQDQDRNGLWAEVRSVCGTTLMTDLTRLQGT